jgi:hypothetical protein
MICDGDCDRAGILHYLPIICSDFAHAVGYDLRALTRIGGIAKRDAQSNNWHGERANNVEAKEAGSAQHW